ncbi:GH36-type glycosyl hydrolase domain-containing protein [Flavobacterium sp.]|uniref:GH36-type glycosyl hydrolase domain-containing protein n=1 Tax=Flavobacterium sp. TaxID=239 RepID=UPI003D0C4707
MRKIISLLAAIAFASTAAAQQKIKIDKELSEKIKNDQYMPFVKSRALEVIKTGINAGDGYREVWIRDYNTFIELALQVTKKEDIKENLLVFFRMQGEDGNIIDGYTPKEEIGAGETDFSYSKLEPRYAAHKNTVETDQETSLVQAVYKYIMLTGDKSILREKVGDKTVAKRLEWGMEFLMENRYTKRYGLITGATTADWGDVQPEDYGIDISENTHFACDIYDNAMFIVALNNMMEIIPATRIKWSKIKTDVAKNTRTYLWDAKKQKYIPHLYLNGSPFSADFDENNIFYFGGTTVAMEAGLLTKKEIKASFEEMVKRVKEAGAPSIGLTLYPPYPNGFFKNKIMNTMYSYQNGGDWTWFGARTIQQLIKYGFVNEAYREVQPMLKRVKDNNGFYEWYSIKNEPRGSGTFRGEAGVLYTTITMFENLNK